jgi:hypothetical protein
MRCVPVLVLAVACSSPRSTLVDASPGDDASLDAESIDAFTGVTSDQARSGTRLKVRWLATADGVYYPTGDYYDSGLDTICTRQHFDDAKDYCAPRAEFPTIGYLDSACTIPTIRTIDASQTLPPFVGVVTGSTITTWKTMYRTGPINETVQGPLTPRPFWIMENGACTSNPTEGWNHELTELSFVELTTSDEGTGRVQEQWEVGSDGFGMIRNERGYDTAVSAGCTLSPIDTTCQPTGLRTQIDYADASCTLPKVASGPSGAFALVGSTLHAIGAPTTAAGYRRNQSGTCVQMIPNAGTPPYSELGAAIGPIAEVTYSLAPDVGQRVRPYAWTATDFSLHSGVHYDTLLDIDCMAGTSCVPYPSSMATRKFTDTACSIPIDVLDSRRGNGPYAKTLDNEYKPVGPVYSGTLHILTSTGCEVDFETSGVPFYTLGAAYDSSMFEVFTQLTDP